MDGKKRIALTAHDAAKPALVAWTFANERTLALHDLTATGNTGRMVMEGTRLTVDCLRSGVLGGDMELGALIAEGRIDVLVFFTDPLTPKPHVKTCTACDYCELCSAGTPDRARKRKRT